MSHCVPDHASSGIKAVMVCDKEFALAGGRRAEGWLQWLCQGRCGSEAWPEATRAAQLGLLRSLVNLL